MFGAVDVGEVNADALKTDDGTGRAFSRPLLFEDDAAGAAETRGEVNIDGVGVMGAGVGIIFNPGKACA